MRFAWGVIAIAVFVAPAHGEVDFATEVMPVLTKAGCNAGACHGAAAGRGGFRLSLLGGDANADYDAIVHEFEGRRINLAKPAASLLLLKPTGYLNHGGELVLPEESVGAKRIGDWIRDGAPQGRARNLTEFKVAPGGHRVEAIPATVSLRALAKFDAGPEEDVTEQTLFTSADGGAVEIDLDTSRATIKRRGQHVIIARFLNRVVPMQILVPLSDKRVDLTSEARSNFIDDEVLRRLTMLRLPVSSRADDATYLRRVRLDLTGRLPTSAEVTDYVNDSAGDRKTKLVDRLLASEDFAEYWTLHFARLLRLHSLPNEPEVATTYARWIREQIAADRPLNAWLQELLTATGDSTAVGPANFPRMVNDARAQAELVGEVFLGVRLGCANCHNHPLDRWTQDDYHGLAAVFSRLERGRHVKLGTRGGVTNPRTGEPALPCIPGEQTFAAEGDHRESVARWLTSPDNERLARATVNRLWKAMFGRGLVEPVDNLSETNPATHPELLARLAQDFAAHDYRLRHTLRLIALSETYARSSKVVAGNEADDRFYSRAFHRPLGPEVLADAIADVTGVPHDFAQQPAGTRAVALVDPLSPAPELAILGRCSRASGCDEQALAGGLPAQLHLLNGPFINARLKDRRGTLRVSLDRGESADAIVQAFFERGFSRSPTANELTHWRAKLGASDEQAFVERCEDFVWSLLNSRDFRENR